MILKTGSLGHLARSLTSTNVLLPSTPISGLRALHIGGYWRGANDMVRQMMLGLAETGVAVTEFCTDEHPAALETSAWPYDRGTTAPVWLRWEQLGPLVTGLEPHLVVCNAGGLSFRPEDAARLRGRTCVIGIALSDPDVHAATTSKIAPNFDLFLTNAPDLVPAYDALGAVCAPLEIGTHPDFFRRVPARPEMACDVLVVGRAHADRIDPVRVLARTFDLRLYGEGWEEHGLESRGLLFGDDLLAALASARTTVVFFRTPSGAPILKVGLFDFLAAGALVLTNRSPVTARHFDFDTELVGFDSTTELVEKVRFLLARPDVALSVRQAGRARVLRDHTWKQVWCRLLVRLGAAA